jgi:hypothetical protein
MWEFDGKNWQLISSPHQPIRCDDNGCLFQYDSALRRSVLVGEERTSQQLLAWDGHEWVWPEEPGRRRGCGLELIGREFLANNLRVQCGAASHLILTTENLYC